VILLAGEADAVLPDADNGGDDADLEPARLQPLALFDMSLEIADVAAALDGDACSPRKACACECLTHGAIAGAVARGVDICFAHPADKGAAAEERAEMAFLIAPGSDFHRAFDARVGVEHTRGLQRIDDAERTVEPARIVLAFEVRAGQQFWPGFVA